MKIGNIGKTEITTSQLKIVNVRHFSLNSIVKNAILLTLAGYLEKDNILVSSEKYYPYQGKMERFFSYILNDKRAAPRKFKLKIEYEGENKQTTASLENNSFDRIISFSGGIDSTAGLFFALDKKLSIKPIWLGFGQKNEENELRVVKSICGKLKIEPLIIKIDMKEYVERGWSRWKLGIIPARNYLFAAIASSIAAKSTKRNVQIYICAHKEEVNPVNTDKSIRFFKTCTDIFKQAYKRNIELTSPFLRITKPEILSYWRKNWIKRYKTSPYETISCYLGNNCGNCKACINRAIAFSCADMQAEGFESNPFADKDNIIRSGYIERFKTLKLERKLDFLHAMQMNRSVLPNSLKKFLDNNYVRYEKKINRRIVNIKNANFA